MSANKIKKPILLIHGEEDNNSGTLTMQVDSKILFLYYTICYICANGIHSIQMFFLLSDIMFVNFFSSL